MAQPPRHRIQPAIGVARIGDAAFAAFIGVRRRMCFLPGNHGIGDNPLETGPSS